MEVTEGHEDGALPSSAFLQIASVRERKFRHAFSFATRKRRLIWVFYFGCGDIYLRIFY